MRGDRLDHRAIRWWSGTLMRIFGFRVRRYGTPLPGAALFVANHVSWIDIVAAAQPAHDGLRRQGRDRALAAGRLARQPRRHHLPPARQQRFAGRRDARRCWRACAGPRGRRVPRGPHHPRRRDRHRSMRASSSPRCEAGVPVQPVALTLRRARRRADHRRVRAGAKTSCSNFLRLLGEPGRRGRGAFPRADRRAERRRPPPHGRNRAASASSRRMARLSVMPRRSYRPPRWLRNPHLQSVLSSSAAARAARPARAAAHRRA